MCVLVESLYPGPGVGEAAGNQGRPRLVAVWNQRTLLAWEEAGVCSQDR